MGKLVIPFLFFFCKFGMAQQNITFYFQHQVPHTNLLNPAVQSSCKWYMGVPLISSTHFNFGNNAGSVRDFMQFSEIDQDKFLRVMPRKAQINTEIHLNLVSFGFKRRNVFWSFFINERTDAAVFIPKSIVTIVLKGNRTYEGKQADFSGLAAYGSYVREYSVGWAKTLSPILDIGFHAKLLFGKANINTTQSRNSIFTHPDVFDLTLASDLKFNISSPMILQINQDGLVNGSEVNTSIPAVLFNRSNIGIGIDAGFIKRPSEDITLAGSILDLGFVYWTTNPYRYSHSGDFFYDGPLGDSPQFDNYSDDIYSDASSDLNAVWNQKNYISFLSPRLYLGYQKKLSTKFAWSATGTAKIYRYKVIPGLSLGLNANLAKSIVCTASFSYLNHSFKNLGLGIVLGNNPFQFYMVSDNIFGLIYPLRYRTINLRTGFVLKFGCNRKKKRTDNCGCEWLRQAEERNLRHQRLMHQ